MAMAMAMAKRIQPVDRLVGQNIRIFRMAKSMSQSELGDALGVSFQQVQKYEKGANRVGSSRLARIAEVLDVPIGQLFDNKADSSEGAVSGPVVTDLLAVPHAVQMLRAFAGLPGDELRRSLLNLTESIGRRAKN
jgi:transcriptional regulator with XRE-family HTH domain